MDKKIIGICICMLLITTTLSITGTVTAEDAEGNTIEEKADDGSKTLFLK